MNGRRKFNPLSAMDRFFDGVITLVYIVIIILTVVLICGLVWILGPPFIKAIMVSK